MTEITVSNPNLVRLIAGLADNKHFLGRRYAEWCSAAPTLESAVAAASMAQDEIGHARSFYPLLLDVAGSSRELEPETRSAFINAPFLDRAFQDWTDFVAANFLFDTSLTVLIGSAVESTFAPLGQRARRILEEETFHWLHSEGWTRRLAREGNAVQQALEKSFRYIGDQCLQVLAFATPDLVDEGILKADSEILGDLLRARVNPVLSDSGFFSL